MASIAGSNSWPSAVKAYSTEGGDVGLTSRETTPLPSNSRSRAVSIFDETGGISAFNSLNRRGPAPKYQMMLGVQAPPIIERHSVNGHSGGGDGLLLLRTFKDIAAPRVTRR